MCRKLFFLTSCVLMLAFVNVNNAADIVWTGAGADNLWSNPANWEGNKVPTAGDDAMPEVPGAAAPNGPLIQDGIDAECAVLWNEVAGEPTMTMTGGTLTISGWGIWWGDGPGCNATFNMSGGTVSLTGSPGIHEFAWGGASGTWIMTGGTVNAKGVKLTTSSGVKGELLLHGGTYNIGTARGGLNMEEGNGLIDITEGTLILEGDERAKINDLIAAGKITAYGGAGQFAMDYDGRNPGSTTVTAIEAGKAYNPDPADGSIYEDTWASLSWSPADAVASHDIYFGEDSDEVNNGAGDTFRGNQGDTFYIVGFPGYPYPDGLVPGTTYYWRVDEVEADGTISNGNVWSFRVPPKTAFNPDPADGAEFVDPDAELSWAAGFGAMLHTVYFGDNFDVVSNATGGTSQGATTHTPGPLEGEKVYYWRVDEFDAAATHKGDVWAFSTPGAVGNPNPANGATGVQMNATLGWTPGDSATSSEVYFGTDKDAVRNATSASPEYQGSKALGSESHDPGKLAWHSTYYWRVDGIESLNAASPWKGNVWSFETADFISVDDFESYNDLAEGDPGSKRIYVIWIDGLGTTTNGSTVGYVDLPLLEHGDVHGGGSSMPYSYDNDLKYSEANMTLVYPRDWTEEDVGVLSLWFKGEASNAAAPMYVILNGSAVVYHDDPAAAQANEWTQWTIELKEFASQGVELTNVDSVGIGFGDKNNVQAGGSGNMLFDDIQLRRPAAAGVDPSLVGWWEFDEGSGTTASDSSGNDMHGVLVNDPVWRQDGVHEGCLFFDGNDAHVRIPHQDSLNPAAGSFTFAFWASVEEAPGASGNASWDLPVAKRDSGSMGYYIGANRSQGTADQTGYRFMLGDTDANRKDTGYLPVPLGEWVFVAAVLDRGNNEQKISVDGGQTWATTTPPPGPILPGQDLGIGWDIGQNNYWYHGRIDDVRFYNRNLSDAEIAALANVQ
jgi:hypothetical protein